MYGLFLLNNSILQLIYCYLPKKAVHNERSAKSYFNYWMVTIPNFRVTGYNTKKRDAKMAPPFNFNTLNEKPALSYFLLRNILSIPSTSSTMESQVLVRDKKE
ncbi:hypothetical protein SAMN05660293_04044 [Dyadobacter psychrophilus]|uniref:Uncharacterized protein n=1 Tax=Dyadobacter psychrophilus TaxID=651661 RepID=A0A1T5GK32_9BACT|nr:hypothetical protein SAMN05660293_04044 [Dyadobacter psychrophilus]